MAMGLGERVKPLLLATLLVFMVGSYFVSDTFKRGASIDRVWVDIAHLKTVSKSVCARRPKQELAACQASIAEALVVTNLACMGPIRDAFACENPTSGKNQGEESCGEETIRLFECIPVHLEPQLQRRGFSGEEIADFVFGSEGLTKQHPAPTAGEGQGQGGKGGDGQGGKGEGGGGDEAGGKKAEVVPEAGGGGRGDGGGAGPEVEVVAGPKDGDSNA